MRIRRRKRTHNGRLFKARRAYSFEEIARILHTHVRTVQVWRSDGLKILPDNGKPFLVMGYDLRAFLTERLRSRKMPLKAGEFYCPRCRMPRRSQPNRLSAVATGRRLGPTHMQVILRGVCEICSQRLTLFSSEQKTARWTEIGLIFAEPLRVINGSEISSVSTDIPKGQENA